MNRRLGISQRPVLARAEESLAPGEYDECEEATTMHFTFEQAVVGAVSGGAFEPLVVDNLPYDQDEPTLEYPRLVQPRTGSSRPEWYVRLRLTQDRIAKLWVRRLAPLDVLVWWEDQQTWAPPLSVPEVRSAIATMRSKEETRRRTRGEPSPPNPKAAPVRAKEKARRRARDELPPPPAPKAPAVEQTHEVDLQRSTWVEEWRQRVAAESRMTPAVRALVSGARRRTDPAQVLRPPEIRPPPSSLPPVVVDVELPQIPPSPRVPDVEAPLAPKAARPTPVAAAPQSAVERPARQSRDWRLGPLERVFWVVAALVLAGLALFSRFARPTTTRPATSVTPVAAQPKPSSAPSSPLASTSAASTAPAPSASASSAGTRVASAGKHRGRSESRAPTPSRSRVSPSASRPPAVSSTPSALASAPDAASSATTPSRIEPAPAVLSRDLGGFDAAAARRALISASHQVGYCGEGWISGSVVVTFATSGFVQSTSLASLRGENVRSDCVLRAFQAVRITPFAGRPVTVSKSFRVK